MARRNLIVVDIKEALARFGDGEYLSRDYIIPATVNQVYDCMSGKRDDVIYIRSPLGQQRPYVIIKERNEWPLGYF